MAEDGDGRRLFVYGVDQNTTNEDLRSMFQKFGHVVGVKNTGKGFAFVTFDQKTDASTAMEEMNGVTVNGQLIQVNEARGGHYLLAKLPPF